MTSLSRESKPEIYEVWPVPHLQMTYDSWKKVQRLIDQRHLEIDGNSVDLADVVAVARHECVPRIKPSERVTKGVEDGVSTLHNYLSKGYFLWYFLCRSRLKRRQHRVWWECGHAHNDSVGLQKAPMQHTQSAVLSGVNGREDKDSTNAIGLHSMPSSWTKATMLVRCNSNIRGHSAMSLSAVSAILELLRWKISPIVPLRGSISASYDLMLLSYIVGAIQGNPDTFVWMSLPEGQHKIINSQQALDRAGIDPIVLCPKEGLSLINRTAPSAAVASLALHDSHELVDLSQLLTALTSEALAANIEWAHPFLTQVRPHSGRIEAAQNIRTFLSGSRLSSGLETKKNRFNAGLAQERYALRSSPQWIRPIWKISVLQRINSRSSSIQPRTIPL